MLPAFTFLSTGTGGDPFEQVVLAGAKKRLAVEGSTVTPFSANSWFTASRRIGSESTSTPSMSMRIPLSRVWNGVVDIWMNSRFAVTHLNAIRDVRDVVNAIVSTCLAHLLVPGPAHDGDAEHIGKAALVLSAQLALDAFAFKHILENFSLGEIIGGLNHHWLVCIHWHNPLNLL